jgi:hypothetical protein
MGTDAEGKAQWPTVCNPGNWLHRLETHTTSPRSLGQTAKLRRYGKYRNLLGAPAGIRTPNQQIMRRFEGHQ